MTKILFLLEDYNLFYTQESEKRLEQNPLISYKEILDDLIAKKYYQSDSMAVAFNDLGFETSIIVPEANPLQIQWAKENNTLQYFKWFLEKPLRSFKARILKQYRTCYNRNQFGILFEQVKTLKPDVIYFYSNVYITEKQLVALRTVCKTLILQWSSPVWKGKLKYPYGSFDLIVTAALQIEAYFKEKGHKTFYLQQAFDENILNAIGEKKDVPIGDIVFIGNFTPWHIYRFEVVEYLLQNGIDITVFGTGKETLPSNSLVYQKIKAPLFGLDMYKEYRKYKMALHVHATVDKQDGLDWGKYAGAKRPFEITGVGTLLLSSYQENLKDLFELDKEIVAYTSPEDLLIKIRYYLSHPSIMEEISKNGMQRTLKDHSFAARARELSKELF
jgi:glycosyltransferase involved in cell wall biosynthesis